MNDNKTKTKKMALQQFGPWLEEKAGAEIKSSNDRTDAVVNIDHIEPGCFAALFAKPSVDGLVIFELAAYFNSKDEALEALAGDHETYPPILFDDWVNQQYLTDKTARVERFEL